MLLHPSLELRDHCLPSALCCTIGHLNRSQGLTISVGPEINRTLTEEYRDLLSQSSTDTKPSSQVLQPRQTVVSTASCVLTRSHIDRSSASTSVSSTSSSQSSVTPTLSEPNLLPCYPTPRKFSAAVQLENNRTLTEENRDSPCQSSTGVYSVSDLFQPQQATGSESSSAVTQSPSSAHRPHISHHSCKLQPTIQSSRI